MFSVNDPEMSVRTFGRMPRTPRFDLAAAIAAKHHSLLSRSEAADAGLTSDSVRQLLRRGVLTEPCSGVLAVGGSVDTWRQRLCSATMAIDGVPVASHRSSARLQDVDGFEDDLVEVTVPHGYRVRRGETLVHQLSRWFEPAEIVVVDGIRCTGLVRTLCDLGTVVDPKRLERAVDDYQRRGRSLRALEIEAVRLHRAGQRGTKRLLAEVHRREGGGRVRDSWFEKLVEECLQSPLIPGLERQYPVRDSSGRIFARCDLAVPLVRLGIEAHSREFHLSPLYEGADGRRDWKAAQAGWEIIYLGWRDTEAPSVVRREIEAIVQQRATDFGITLPAQR